MRFRDLAAASAIASTSFFGSGLSRADTPSPGGNASPVPAAVPAPSPSPPVPLQPASSTPGAAAVGQAGGSAAVDGAGIVGTESGHLGYGAALAIAILGSAGPACPSRSSVPCIFGSGGGLALRFGYRFHTPWYIGAAYDFSKHDANKLLRLPILQQLRAEARFELPSRTQLGPYLVAGAGVAGYGSEWDIRTYGPAGLLGFGIEAQLARHAIFTIQVAYRPIYFGAWTDPAGQDRSAGVVSFVGLEFGLEQRDGEAPSEDR